MVRWLRGVAAADCSDFLGVPAPRPGVEEVEGRILERWE